MKKDKDFIVWKEELVTNISINKIKYLTFRKFKIVICIE